MDEGNGCLIAFISIIVAIGTLVGGYILLDRLLRGPNYTVQIQKAVEKQDFEKAHKLLDKQAIKWRRLVGGKKKIQESRNFVVNAEIVYLGAHDDQASSERLIRLMQEYPIINSPFTGNSSQFTDSKKIKQNDKYNEEVSNYNAICDRILDFSITRGNKYLAEHIISMYKPLVTKVVVEEHLFDEDIYSYVYSETIREQAREKLKRAIQEGAFKSVFEE